MELNSTYLIDDANLQGYWRMESGGLDASDNAYNLAHSTSMDTTTGVFGTAYDSTRADKDYLYRLHATGIPNLQITGDVSVTMWAKVDNVSVYTCLLSLSGDRNVEVSGGNTLYRIAVTTSKKIEIFHEYGSGTNVAYTFQDDIPIGEWFHLAFVKEQTGDGKWHVFINNVEDGSGYGYPNNATDGSQSNLYIGGSINVTLPEWNLEGSLDDVAVFDRILTDSEIALLYYPGMNVSESISVSESVNVCIVGGQNVSDSISVSESVSVMVYNYVVNVSDTVTLSEEFIGISTTTLTVRDGLQISIWKEDIFVTDSPQFPGPRSPAFEDNISVSDTPTVKIVTPGTNSNMKPSFKVEY